MGAGKWRWLLRGAIVLVAAAVGFIAWTVTHDNGEESSSSSTTSSSAESAPVEAGGPRIVTTAELREAAATLGQPIYWAGPMPGKQLELTELSGGSGGVQVSYIPEGARAGQGPAAKWVTIGSYPLSDPAAALKAYAKRPDAVVKHSSDGREIVTSEKRPTSVYFAGDGNKVQVEIYSPSVKQALTLALLDKVQPASG